ncbi:HAMP domain-containing sensor histidine kinase, partial [uncultured Intestinimonas sp.]
MKSLYQRQFFIMAGVILVSFALLGSAFITLSYRYTVSERQDSIGYNARYIAGVLSQEVSVDSEQGGFYLVSDRFQPAVDAVVSVTEATVLLTSQTGQIIYAAGSAGELAGLADAKLPAVAVQSVQAIGSFESVTTLDGLFAEQRYVVGVPFRLDYRGQQVMAGMVFVAAKAASITEMWRAFASIFLFTSVVVMLIAFITTSVTSLRMTRPLKDMAEAVRKFGHGEYETRVDCTGRCDEVGELAEAFNAMADSIAQAEAKRSEFVANISHELKTPMTTIAGFADGILDGTIPPGREKEYLKVISSETRRLSRLVRKMLDLSRLQSSERVTAQEQFDISEVMLRVLVSLETKINAKGLDVDTQLPDDPVQVWGDPDAITQVCYNLLDNAIKFSYLDTTLGISVAARAGKAYVSVRNHGDTIPPEEIPLVFDRFHKTDRSRSEDRDGVGLGLYIVKTILNSHKENITVTSEDGLTE